MNPTKEITLTTITKKAIDEMKQRSSSGLKNYVCINCMNVSMDKITWYIVLDLSEQVTYTTTVCDLCMYHPKIFKQEEVNKK